MSLYPLIYTKLANPDRVVNSDADRDVAIAAGFATEVAQPPSPYPVTYTKAGAPPREVYTDAGRDGAIADGYAAPVGPAGLHPFPGSGQPGYAVPSEDYARALGQDAQNSAATSLRQDVRLAGYAVPADAGFPNPANVTQTDAERQAAIAGGNTASWTPASKLPVGPALPTGFNPHADATFPGSGQPNSPVVNPSTADNNIALASIAGDLHQPTPLPGRDLANRGFGPYQENAPGRSTLPNAPLPVPMVAVPASGRYTADEHNSAMASIAAQQLLVIAETDKLNLMRGQFSLFKHPDGN